MIPINTESVNHEYAERVRQQIAQYADTLNVHELPDIFHVWSNEYVRPGMERVFNTCSTAEFYGRAYLEAKTKTNGSRRILSVGCGDGSIEMSVAKWLIENGEFDFKLICADISPILLDRLRVVSREEGLASVIVPVEADLNKTPLDGEFDVIMAHHSLHHIVELERLFSYCRQHLKDWGLLATNDMIGRNGHLRWPEAAAIVKSVWPMLRPEAKYHAQLRVFNEGFMDHDCSTEGFEGVRAQDILPLLLDNFHPYKFHAFGGFIELLVDRGYGHAYDVKNKEDITFIRFLADINDVLLDAGVIKPTVMMAYFAKTGVGWPETYYRNRRAATCVRRSTSDWIKFYDR